MLALLPVSRFGAGLPESLLKRRANLRFRFPTLPSNAGDILDGHLSGSLLHRDH
jgi:hypothetical protein